MTFCRLIYVSDLTLVHISGLPLGLSSSDDGELLEYELEAEAAGVQLVGSVVYFIVGVGDEFLMPGTSLIIEAKVTLLLAAVVAKGILVDGREIPLAADAFQSAVRIFPARAVKVRRRPCYNF